MIKIKQLLTQVKVIKELSMELNLGGGVFYEQTHGRENVEGFLSWKKERKTMSKGTQTIVTCY